MTTITTPADAYAAGRAAAHTAPLHDLMGHMQREAIPLALRGNYLSGIEDELEVDWDAQDEADAARIEQIAEQAIWEMAL